MLNALEVFSNNQRLNNPVQNRYTPVFDYHRLSRRRLAEAGGQQRTRGAADHLFSYSTDSIVISGQVQFYYC